MPKMTKVHQDVMESFGKVHRGNERARPPALRVERLMTMLWNGHMSAIGSMTSKETGYGVVQALLRHAARHPC
jgi:hypothetical protein